MISTKKVQQVKAKLNVSMMKRNIHCVVEANWHVAFCIAEVRGFHCWSCPVVMIKRKMIIKLPKSYLERVPPQTKADSDLQPKLVCPAPYFGNALLVAGILLTINSLFKYQIRGRSVLRKCCNCKKDLKYLVYESCIIQIYFKA